MFGVAVACAGGIASAPLDRRSPADNAEKTAARPRTGGDAAPAETGEPRSPTRSESIAPAEEAAVVEPSVVPPVESAVEPSVEPSAEAAVEPSAEPAVQTPVEAVRRVLILGDSMAATDFGRELERALASETVTTRRRGKSATGLARPDFFDWMAEGARQVDRHDPDVVVVILGGNDGQDLIGGPRRVRWGAPEWEAAYAERLDAFAGRLLTAPERRLIWVALPRMARPKLEQKLALIRRVQFDALGRQPRAEYLDTGPWFFDGEGRDVSTVEWDGKVAPLRQDDGIHFSVHGARWFAGRVAPEILRRLR